MATVPFLAPTALAQVDGAALADPALNVPRTPAMELACGTGPDQCQVAVVQAIDQARAAEGLAALDLPANYDSLTVPEQVFLLADLERVDRGLPGFTGLSSSLDQLALKGAASNNDPNGPEDQTWGSNWAGGEASALLADYDWMYDDGPGSPNLDCTSSSVGGCWDHRRNVLGDYGPGPSMGAAATLVNGVTSLTEIFSSGQAGHLDYALATSAPGLVTPSSVSIATTPSAPRSALLTVSDGEGSFQASASVAGNRGLWSVTPSCVASAGAKCHLLVTFAPRQRGTANATVTVTLPGHTAQVNVDAYAGAGYWEVTSGGRIFAYGGGPTRGSLTGLRLAQPVVGMAPTPDGGGYWEVAADGGVFSFGDARFLGSGALLHLGRSVVGMAVAHDGGGYWLATKNGNIYSFGDAKYYGAPSGTGGKVVSLVATPDGLGYWLATSNGSVYSFGDARYYGPRSPLELSGPVVGMAATPEGGGYWLVTANGSIYSFGNATFHGSAQGHGQIVGVAASPAGPGYYITNSKGAVFSFGTGPAAGHATGVPGASRVVAMAAA